MVTLCETTAKGVCFFAFNACCPHRGKVMQAKKNCTIPRIQHMVEWNFACFFSRTPIYPTSFPRHVRRFEACISRAQLTSLLGPAGHMWRCRSVLDVGEFLWYKYSIHVWIYFYDFLRMHIISNFNSYKTYNLSLFIYIYIVYNGYNVYFICVIFLRYILIVWPRLAYCPIKWIKYIYLPCI